MFLIQLLCGKPNLDEKTLYERVVEANQKFANTVKFSHNLLNIDDI